MFGVALLTSALLALADARIYERCELARDLIELGVRREHLATWVCIAYHESRFDTAARNPYSGDHGLLQISELYWCGAGKACSLPCSALRDDDISDDVECALQVHKEHTRLQGNGFLAWVVYPQHCKHNAKKYLADCDSSVKTPSTRVGGRSRVSKSRNRNVTSFSYNPKIDELLPPYLTIGSLFDGNYEKEFEDNYNNKVRFDWLNYKIDNIDELKLPVFNQKVTEEYTRTTWVPRTSPRTSTTTTTTTSTTTTTTSSPLPKIKPPSPRRIESNSFRKKKLRPIFEPVQFVETSRPSSTSLSTSTPRNTNISTTENLQRSDNKRKSVSKTDSSFIITTTTTTNRPTTKSLEISPFTALSSTTDQLKTTKPPIAYTSRPTQSTKAQELSSKSTERSSTTTSPLDQNTINKSVNYSLLDEKINSSMSKIESIATVKPISILTSTTIAPIVTTKSYSLNLDKYSTLTSTTTWRPWTRSWQTWKTTPNYPAITTTTKPILTTRRAWWTENTSPSTIAKINKETRNTTKKELKNESTTSKPWTHSRWRQTSQIVPTEISKSNTSISSSRTLLVSTTPKPHSTISTINTRSTANPELVVKSTKIVTSTELPSTTARTTQSIFDLYLNPTTRPKLPSYSFRPFKNIASLKIFSGGTTTQSLILSGNNTSSASEETMKNKLR